MTGSTILSIELTVKQASVQDQETSNIDESFACLTSTQMDSHATSSKNLSFSTPDDKSYALICTERKYGALNYTPLPFVMARGLGTRVWDVDGRELIDFGGAYCAMNLGHCHPRLVKVLQSQLETLTLASRAFTHASAADFCRVVTKTFGYERVLPLNGGAEAVECAIKLARSWGYSQLAIPSDQALVLTFTNNYHGRTSLATSMSSATNNRTNYGPFIPGVSPFYDASNPTKKLVYNDEASLRAAFDTVGSRICAVLVESVQGEAGVIVPSASWLRFVRDLCRSRGALYIADEIQVGLGRCGHMVACTGIAPDVRPDVLLLAKSLSGGTYPTSVVLADSHHMAAIRPNTHGATFSGSPLSTVATIEALAILHDEQLCDRAAELGPYLVQGLCRLRDVVGRSAIGEIRGIGLLVAFDVHETQLNRSSERKWTAWHLSMLLMSRGILAKLVQSTTLKLTPPLTVTKQELDAFLTALDACLRDFSDGTVDTHGIPGVDKYAGMLGGSSTLV
ncbi:ornithine aminotransferase [Savitreella phatthalungensis]